MEAVEVVLESKIRLHPPGMLWYAHICYVALSVLFRFHASLLITRDADNRSPEEVRETP